LLALLQRIREQFVSNLDPKTEYPEVLRSFPQSFQISALIVLQINHESYPSIPPNLPFAVIYHSMLYRKDAEPLVKPQQMDRHVRK
jgi:hypothetical protein